MIAEEGMFKEDAEKLARQIQDDNPMIDILEIKLDPEVGGYVISAYDNSTDEEFVIRNYDFWAERKTGVRIERPPEIVVKISERKGTKTASLMAEFERVPEERWPDDICGAVSQRKIPGLLLQDVEPAVSEADMVEPGHGAPADYGVHGNYLVLVNTERTRVWRLIQKLANFTLVDQSDLVDEWRFLGFEIDPVPKAPMIELGSEDWKEEDVLEEVRQRLLDISEAGFGAILVDGDANTTAYAWVLAGVMGLKVILGWTGGEQTYTSGSRSIGFTELLHYRDVEGSF